MAISAYVGLMGSGKSYNAVKNVLIPAWKQQRKTYTNIPLDIELIEQHFGVTPVQFTIEEIQEDETWFDQVENGSVVVLDECWELWPAGTKSTNIRLDQKDFLTKHRHKVGENGKIVEPVFVTQDLSQLASFVRNLVNTTYHHVKQDQIGVNNRYRVDVYSGAVTGQKPPVKRRIREFYGKYESDTFIYYKSQTQSKSDLHGDEQSTDKRNNILKSPMMIFYAVFPFVVLAFVIFYGLPALKNFFGGGDDMQQPINNDIEKIEGGSPSPDQNNSPPARPKPRLTPEQIAIKHLFDVNKVYISYSEFYKFSRKQKGTYFYSFTFENNDNKSLVKQFELERFDVSVISVNECLALILFNNKQYSVQCYKHVPEETNHGVDLANAAPSL